MFVFKSFFRFFMKILALSADLGREDGSLERDAPSGQLPDAQSAPATSGFPSRLCTSRRLRKWSDRVIEGASDKPYCVPVH